MKRILLLFFILFSIQNLFAEAPKSIQAPAGKSLVAVIRASRSKFITPTQLVINQDTDVFIYEKTFCLIPITPKDRSIIYGIRYSQGLTGQSAYLPGGFYRFNAHEGQVTYVLQDGYGQLSSITWEQFLELFQKYEITEIVYKGEQS